MLFDEIVAISTAYGKAAISVIRMSGENSIKMLNRAFKGKDLTKVKSHTINYGHIMSDKNEIIDEVMVSVFHAPKSFTSENMVEVSTHGGILVTNKVLERLLEIGFRLARPGEFSERAYLNGRIDLVQAEAVMDLIEARTNQALKIAHLGLNKESTKLVNNLQDKLLSIIAQIEVNIDYPEYDDAIIMSKEIIGPETKSLLQEINHIIKESEKNQIIREGVKTVIVGRPNVGKSSLLNALLNEDKAIVTDIAGTTRDTIEAEINIGGIILHLIDTAGIRETKDYVEKLGVERSKKALLEAELALLVLDSSEELTSEDLELLELTKDKKRLIIGNKADIDKRINLDELIFISALHKKGFETLEEKILKLLELSDILDRDYNYLSNARHIQKLKEAKNSLEQVLKSIELNMPVDVYAIDLTDAWHKLLEILGVRFENKLIDELFSKFCLGK